MNTLERILDAAAAGGTAATSHVAAAALERLRSGGLPVRRHEDWRYANLAALDAVPNFLSPAPASNAAGLPALLPAELPPALAGYQRMLLVDGRLIGDLPAGLRPAPASAAGDDPRGLGRFAQLADALAPTSLAFEVSGSLALEILVISGAPSGASYASLELRLAAAARVRLAERHCGDTGAHGLACCALRLDLARGSELQHQRLLDLGGNGLHLDSLEATLADHASYSQRCLAIGAGTLRSTQSVSLAGAQSALDWQALAVAGGREVRDLLLATRHEAPGTSSQQRFRGIADGRARVACGSDALVAASAPGARVAQSLRGLLDGESAEVDLKPRLTILTDDVQATHGATTGRLDDDLLFYLLARGLDAAEARALLKWAFLGEVFAGCEPAALRLAAERAIAARLRDRPPVDLLQ